MIALVQAETLKLLRHRGLWGLVWIVPVGLVVLWLIGTGLHLAHIAPHVAPHGPAAHRGPPPPDDAASWIAGTALVWKFAMSGFGRYLIGGFAALAFAGEYGWSTWKLIVPHSSRARLIAAKYLVVMGVQMAAFVLTAMIAVALEVVEATFDQPIPAGVGIGALLAAHGAGFAAALISTALTVAYAAAGAVLLRSTMGGLIVVIVAVTLERVAGGFAMLIPQWVMLVLPTAHLDGVQSWIATGHAAMLLTRDGVFQLGWGVSAAVLAAWIGGLVGLTFFRFARQDLT